MMTIKERHVAKFQQVLKAEGFPAAQRFELVDVAWAKDKHALSRSIDWLENNLAALERMLKIIRAVQPFCLSDDGKSFWFTYSGSPRAHYYSRIDNSEGGITVAIFKLVNDTPEVNAETIISNYLYNDEAVTSETVATWTVNDSADRFTRFAKLLNGAQIKGIVERPYGAGLEFCLINNGKPYFLDSRKVNGKLCYTLAQIFPL